MKRELRDEGAALSVDCAVCWAKVGEGCWEDTGRARINVAPHHARRMKALINKMNEDKRKGLVTK